MNKYYQISLYFNGGVRASYHQQYDSVELAQQAINAAFTKKELLQIDGSVINTGKALGFSLSGGGKLGNNLTRTENVLG